jgi:hypothetical protein
MSSLSEHRIVGLVDRVNRRAVTENTGALMLDMLRSADHLSSLVR